MDKFQREAYRQRKRWETEILKETGLVNALSNAMLDSAQTRLHQSLRIQDKLSRFDRNGMRIRLTRDEREILRTNANRIDWIIEEAKRMSETESRDGK